MDKKRQIIVSYIFHAVFILLGLLMMRKHSDILLLIAAVADVLYLLFCITVNRKTHMPWAVYVHFLIGTAVEFVLNLSGIIPYDEQLLMSGMSQLLYLLMLTLLTLLLGFSNLVLWLIHRKK